MKSKVGQQHIERIYVKVRQRAKKNFGNSSPHSGQKDRELSNSLVEGECIFCKSSALCKTLHIIYIATRRKMQSKSRPYLENRVLDFCLLLGIYYENPPHLSKSTKIFIYFFNKLQSRAAPSVHAPKVSKTCQTKSSKIILNRKRWSGR